jgi:hypothetical protein
VNELVDSIFPSDAVTVIVVEPKGVIEIGDIVNVSILSNAI